LAIETPLVGCEPTVSLDQFLDANLAPKWDNGEQSHQLFPGEFCIYASRRRTDTISLAHIFVYLYNSKLVEFVKQMYPSTTFGTLGVVMSSS
jgi:hypothetical protein